MKKNIDQLNFLWTIIICLFLSSCSKQLEKKPFDSILLSQSFKTINDAKNWDLGLYAKLRSNSYGIFTFTTDVQGDQLNASLDYGNRNGGPHRWDWLADDYTLRDTWFGYYNGIANANIMIAGVKNIQTTNSADATSLKQYTGDAYLVRAYYYSQLMLKWAKPYNPSSASSDLGVPIVTTFDVSKTTFPQRSNSQQVYAQILNDIDSAKNMLNGISGKPGTNIFTYDVAIALEARVRFYMQDWNGAKTLADQLINSNVYPLYNTSSSISNMWINDAGGEDILQLSVSAPNELPNINSIYLNYISGSKSYDPDFIPSQWVIDAYSSIDLRKGVYFKKLPVTIQGQKDSLILVTKYSGNSKLFTTAVSNYAQAPKLFRIAEQYLISAEAGYMLSSSTALNTLNTLRTARGIGSINTTGTAVMDSIKMERFRELAFEGFRIDDLKRWHQGFTRHNPQNINYLTPGNNFYTKSVAVDADKFVSGIPANDVTVIGLQQNPGGW